MTTVNHVRPWVQSRAKCSVCCEIDVTTKTANHLKPSEVTLNQQKPSETTHKPPKATCTNGSHPSTHTHTHTHTHIHTHTHTQPQRATSYQILPCFSAIDFEHDFLIRKTELGKNGKNPTMIMNCKEKLWTLSHSSERIL